MNPIRLSLCWVLALPLAAQQAAPVDEPLKLEVRASKAKKDARRMEDPKPQVTETRETFSKRSNVNVGEVLQRMPGVYLSGPAGAAKDLRLRGLDKEFSRLQVDGVALPGGGEKREFQADQIPSFLVEAISIIRNPTADTESDGVAGRVNIQTRSIPRKASAEGRIGSAGSDRAGRPQVLGSAAYAQRPSEAFGFSLGMERRLLTSDRDKAKDFNTGKREEERVAEREAATTFMGDLAYFAPYGEWHLKPLWLDGGVARDRAFLVQDPGKADGRNPEREDKETRTQGALLEFRRPGSAWTWEVRAGRYRSSEAKDKEALSESLSNNTWKKTKDQRELEDKADQTTLGGADVTFRPTTGLQQQIKTGLAFRERDRFRTKRLWNLLTTGGPTELPTPKENYSLSERYGAAYVQDEIFLGERWSLLPGVRFETVRLHSETAYAAPVETTTRDWIPHLHLLVRPTGQLSFRAAISRGVNRPKFDTLAPSSQDKGSQILIGNPNLQPSRSWNLDLGSEWAGPRHFLAFNAFHRRITGLLEEVDTGVRQSGKPVYRTENVGDGWTSGLELEQRWMPVSGLTLWANQTLLDSEVKDASGIRRPFKEQPRFLGNLGVDWTFEPWGTTVVAALRQVGSRVEVKPTGDRKELPAATSLDLALRQRLAKGFTAFAEVQGLGGEKKIEEERFLNGSWTHSEERAERRVLLGLEWRW